MKDGRFDGANDILMLVRNFGRNQSPPPPKDDFSAMKKNIEDVRRSNMKKENKVNLFVNSSSNYDLAFSKMSSDEMKEVIERLEKSVFNSPLDDLPVILAVSKVLDNYYALRVVRLDEENANNNPVPKAKQPRLTQKEFLLDPYDSIAFRKL